MDNVVTMCEKSDCPLDHLEFKKLKKPPCCHAINVPNRFILEANGNRQKAVQTYLDQAKEDMGECGMLGWTLHSQVPQ